MTGHALGGTAAIEWIKKYRAIVGVSLREAKDAYDAGRPMPENPDEVSDAEKFARKRAVEAAASDMLDLLMRAGEADSPNDDVKTSWWERRADVISKATS